MGSEYFNRNGICVWFVTPLSLGFSLVPIFPNFTFQIFRILHGELDCVENESMSYIKVRVADIDKCYISKCVKYHKNVGTTYMLEIRVVQKCFMQLSLARHVWHAKVTIPEEFANVISPWDKKKDFPYGKFCSEVLSKGSLNIICRYSAYIYETMALNFEIPKW